MSTCILVGVPGLFEAIYLLAALYHMRVAYEKTRKMTLNDGSTRDVDGVFVDPNGNRIGVEDAGGGKVKLITDVGDMDTGQLKVQRDFLKQLRQRYSYVKVLDKLKKDGYVITGEEKVQGNTIKISARKWS
jgi:hypothetical protein